MRTRFILWAFIAILASSCSGLENEKPDAGKGHRTFYAVLEQPTALDTKVYADENLKLLWDADDRIAIFDEYTFGYQHKYVGDAGSNAGRFELIPEEEGTFIVGNDIPGIVCAVYPYDELLTINNSGSQVTLTLPSSQVYLANSFGNGSNTMISMGKGEKLSFKNVCGYLALKIYGDDVTVSSITLKGNNNEKIAGKAKINVSMDDAPSLKEYTKGTGSITLECPDPVKIGDSAESATVFWLVVPPTVFEKGFTVTVKDNDGKEFTKASSSRFELKRNMPSRMAPIEAVME